MAKQSILYISYQDLYIQLANLRQNVKYNCMVIPISDIIQSAYMFWGASSKN